MHVVEQRRLLGGEGLVRNAQPLTDGGDQSEDPLVRVGFLPAAQPSFLAKFVVELVRGPPVEGFGRDENFDLIEGGVRTLGGWLPVDRRVLTGEPRQHEVRVVDHEIQISRHLPHRSRNAVREVVIIRPDGQVYVVPGDRTLK